LAGRSSNNPRHASPLMTLTMQFKLSRKAWARLASWPPLRQ
jgi:hypothetical protein